MMKAMAQRGIPREALRRAGAARALRGQRAQQQQQQQQQGGHESSSSSSSFWEFFWQENRRVALFGVVAVAGIALVKAASSSAPPKRAEVLIAKGQLAEHEANPARAAQHFKEALNHIKTSPFDESAEVPVTLMLAENLERGGKIHEATRMYEDIAQREPSVSFDMYARERFLDAQGAALDRLGQLAADAGDARKALNYHLAAVAKLAREPEVLEAVWAAFESGKHDFQPLLKTTARAKNLAGALNNAGMALLAEGREAEARNLLLRCLAVATICVPAEDRDADFQRAVQGVSETVNEL